MSDNNQNNQPKSNPLDTWNGAKRQLLRIFAVLMWVMSLVFSYIGFKSDVQNDWYFGVFAIILSGTITVLELYLTSQTFNFSEVDMGLVMLWIGGIAAYAYGIWTNVEGLAVMMIGPAGLLAVSWQTQVVPIIAGVLLEVLPEPMFIAFLKSRKPVKSVVQRTQEQAQQNAKGHLSDEARRKLPQAPVRMPPRVQPDLNRFRSSR